MHHLLLCWTFLFSLLICALPCGAADEITPSGGPEPSSSALPPSDASAPPIGFEEAIQGLSSVFPLQLSSMNQVRQNSYNWRGTHDASLKCDVGFAPLALVLRGEFRDDLPFFQPMVHPAMPDWWRITYGADGVELLLDDPTSATRRLRLALNFGSAATNPQVELLASPESPNLRQFLPSATIDLADVAGTAAEDGAVQFRVAIPYSSLTDTDFFRGPLRMTVRLHDLDGDYSTYLMMQEIVEKK